MNLFKKYILNEDLEISHRLMNIVLLVGIVVLPICVLFDLVLGAASGTFIPLSLLFVVFVISFILANNRNKANLAGAILTVTASDILLPFLYFRGGGRNSSMPSWFILSAIFVWLLVKGWPCIAIFASNIIVYAVVFVTEYHHPEYVSMLDGEKSEYFDIYFGIVIIVLMIGVIFKFQRDLYEKKRRELEQKEKELTAANIRLEKMSDAKSIFLANMSHEIRTPINAIVGMNEMILRESSEKPIIEYAENVEHASGTLLSLINDILDFSKIEAGLLEILPDEYQTFSVLNDCYSLLEMRAYHKGLKLSLINDPDIPSTLFGDEIRIRQVMINLLTNAVKYTDEGSITIRAEKESHADPDMTVLCLTVEDTGRGMSEEGMTHLFDSYARIDEKKNRNIEGTGLGLAITKQLIDLMGGSISVQSTLGQGSSFTVKIPQKVVSSEPMGTFDRKRRLGISSSKHGVSFKAPDARILVTDDVSMNLKVISMLIKDTKITVDTASCGEECLRKYAEEHYDIVFLDHMMPEMDGIEALSRLKETEKYQHEHTPVIALTANAMLGAEKIYLDTGFSDYLTKPAKGSDLEAMILKHLPDSIKVTYNE